MPLTVVKRSDKTVALTVAEFDGNLTAMVNAVSALESADATASSSIATINSTLSGKIANLVEDTTPELGGDLDGKKKAVYNAIAKVATKGASFTLDPTEATVYIVNAASAITITLPSSLTTCPIGLGFEIHVLNNIQVSFSVDNSSNLVNFSSHTKVTGPKGTGFLRVMYANGSSPVYKLVGNTAA